VRIGILHSGVQRSMSAQRHFQVSLAQPVQTSSQLTASAHLSHPDWAAPPRAPYHLGMRGMGASLAAHHMPAPHIIRRGVYGVGCRSLTKASGHSWCALGPDSYLICMEPPHALACYNPCLHARLCRRNADFLSSQFAIPYTDAGRDGADDDWGTWSDFI
jgi:hypothetical protein